MGVGSLGISDQPGLGPDSGKIRDDVKNELF
jgi:hypothetical protein